VENNFFRIADHTVCLRFPKGDAHNSMALLPSFRPFRIEEPENKPDNTCEADSTHEHADGLLFTLTVDDTLKPRKEKTLVRKFDTGNGDTVVYQLPDGGYQYIIRNIDNADCCLLVCNRDFSQCCCALNGNWVMRSFGLNDALMLIFAFAGAFRQTMLIHASCILYHDCGYPFIAQSGTGKSTHTALWMTNIEGAQLMNDDNPIIRIAPDGQPYIYGSPWSGKTPCYRQVKARLGAVTRIERAPANSIERLAPVQAFASLLPACSSMKWDDAIYDHLCTAVTRVIETTPVYTLHCLPDSEAALLCHSTIAR